MVKTRNAVPLKNDHSVDIQAWLERVPLPGLTSAKLREACQWAAVLGADKKTIYGMSRLEKALETAEILAQLQFDIDSIMAALVFNVIEGTGVSIEDVESQFGNGVSELVKSTLLLESFSQLQQRKYSPLQIDNLRKMLLVMVRDVRVVVIKISERLCVLRHLSCLDSEWQQMTAKETMEIFAPLANRLGLYQLRWELEDLAFYYLDYKAYKNIAARLAEKRAAREQRVLVIAKILSTKLEEQGIKAEVSGRAKHIYGIKKKMDRKGIDISEVYDTIAYRIIVSTIDECYKTLALIHELYTPIPKEFDDYIAKPKPNGYQSIHTAVYDEKHRTFEVQIRTQEMHKVAEQGAAAHWVYKEGAPQKPTYEQKIMWLRYLLEWQKELTHDKELPKELEKNLFEDRVYVFTPQGDIVDLMKGSTPVDFAYHIHTSVGHRCRGAKIHGKIVPLNTPLRMGDQVEILAGKEECPSRDWLLPQNGFLKTSVARAKVLHWFRQQEMEQASVVGRLKLEKELAKLNLDEVSLDELSSKLHFKTLDGFFAAFGKGELKLTQVLQVCPQYRPDTKVESAIPTEALAPSHTTHKEDICVDGVDNLLSKVAKCCKPIPGDPIVGYIKQLQGIAVHRKECTNIAHLDITHQERLIKVYWNEKIKKLYPVDIEIGTEDAALAIPHVTNLIAESEIHLLHLQIFLHRMKKEESKILLTVELKSSEQLNCLIERLRRLPRVYSARRC